MEGFHEGVWYVPDSYTGSRHFDYTEHWNSFMGHYQARNPELSNFRIAFARESWPSLILGQPRTFGAFEGQHVPDRRRRVKP